MRSKNKFPEAKQVSLFMVTFTSISQHVLVTNFKCNSHPDDVLTL
jgi:hypothetical protein